MKSAAIALCLLSGTVFAHAGPCATDIAGIENALRSAASSLVRPSGRQTVGAQLGHQPTPQSVMAAQQQARAGLDAALARAKALDARGQDAECAQAVREAKLILGLQ